jgi:GntR family transcriptional regulator
MEFQAQSSIWMQIAQQLASRIIAGEWLPGERVPSVREFATELQVNPNTVLRSLTYLQDEGLVSNLRGLGYFVAEEGPAKALALRKKVFSEMLLPLLFQNMREIDMGFDELESLYLIHNQKHK